MYCKNGTTNTLVISLFFLVSSLMHNLSYVWVVILSYDILIYAYLHYDYLSLIRLAWVAKECTVGVNVVCLVYFLD